MTTFIKNTALTMAAAGVFCTAWTSFADAQIMSDPTRPPDVINAAPGDPVVTAGPVLQSVLISNNSKIAIISGQTVKLNQKFGEFHLVRISETEAILQNGKAQLLLKLFPDIKKQSINKNTEKLPPQNVQIKTVP
ncbi:hypothetical protein [Glaciimonas immobilis]|uniref:MSHA biogenesis protein MshK n=1 Tax=Glaciimonas immobilis TaxID=728004 RepID=A0A840RJN7_9BURK|nr:hypothetical protein [Glaciimonas immobilis]MBB5198407.1 MSHA biogenesis protein MshK [Glaciimonas immobilis]